jgi:N-acetyl-anhydromuramyl-L-alanine amidase AmpD
MPNFETDAWPYVPARWQTKVEGKRNVRLLVIHDMEAPETSKTAENVANYFKTGTAKASAHLCIDSDSIVQSVLDNNVAFAAPGVNRDGIHLELAGYVKQTEADWLDSYGLLLLERAADAAAQYCLKFDIPPVHLTNDELKAGQRGIIGHYQASAVYPPNAGHQDPGKGFPWNWFIERVTANIARHTALEDHG